MKEFYLNIQQLDNGLIAPIIFHNAHDSSLAKIGELKYENIFKQINKNNNQSMVSSKY